MPTIPRRPAAQRERDRLQARRLRAAELFATMGGVYRETTPAMVARVTAALDDRLGHALAVAAYLLRE